MCDIFEGLGDIFEEFEADFAVGHLPAAEEDGELDLVAILEEAACLVGFDFDIVLIGPGAKAYFLEFRLFGICFCLLVFFLLLVFPLAVVHDAADGGIRVWSDFDEIEACIACALKGDVCIYDTSLSFILIDESDRGDTNAFIDSDPFT